MEYCRDGGKYVVLGQYGNAGNISFNPHTITRKQLQVIGSWGFEPRHVNRALEIPPKSTTWRDLFARQLTHRFALDQANEALQTTRSWAAGKTDDCAVKNRFTFMRKLLWLLIPVVGVIGWLFARNSTPPEVPFTKAARETLVSTLNTQRQPAGRSRRRFGPRVQARCSRSMSNVDKLSCRGNSERLVRRRRKRIWQQRSRGSRRRRRNSIH